MNIRFCQRASVGFTVISFLLAGVWPNGASERSDGVNLIQISAEGQPVKAQVGSDGRIHVLLDSDRGPLYSSSRDGRVTFSEAIAVVDFAAQKPGLSFHSWDLVVGKDGRVHVALGCNAWKLKLPQEEWGLYFATLAPNAKAFSPLRNLNLKPSEGFSLAADARGQVTACFLSGKLFTMASKDDGETFDNYSEPDPAWNPCDCCTTASAYDADGKLALLYREETNNDRDMYLALIDQRRGAKAQRVRVSHTPWKIEGCPMTYFSITATKSGYVAAWPTKGQIYFARLDKNGAVLPPGEIRTPGTNGMRTGILVLSDNDDSTLVAWKNKDVLGWQLYDSKGQPQGNPGSAPSRGNGAAGVALPSGKFLLFP